MSSIQRAILSVTDKTGVVEFARNLAGWGLSLSPRGARQNYFVRRELR